LTAVTKVFSTAAPRAGRWAAWKAARRANYLAGWKASAMVAPRAVYWAVQMVAAMAVLMANRRAVPSADDSVGNWAALRAAQTVWLRVGMWAASMGLPSAVS
jgi:hypothetical protein